ncbi:MAG TPA: PPC domain-containing protein, partial [Archangium sp.]|nr:PPC domain-containing protein [Archangium sp.]
GSVTVRLTMVGGADLDWYLYHSSNTSTYLTRGYTSSNPETASYTVSQTGTYYVKVVGYSGAMSNYSLLVTGAGVQP